MKDVDFVQFARLLDSIKAAGLNENQIKTIATSMEIEPKDVRQLLNRAAARWEDLKPLIEKTTPLSEDQVSEELAENGKAVALVKIDFGEIIGKLDEESLEEFIDDITLRASQVDFSSVDHKVLFAENDTLYIKVSATAEEVDDEDEEVDDDVEPAV
jgi:hypothetical protein